MPVPVPAVQSAVDATELSIAEWRRRSRETAPPTGSGPRSRVPRWLVLASAALCALAAALSVAYVFARAPWWDEGLYADVARQFALHGTLGSPLAGPSGDFGFAEIPRMNERTYWTTPLYPVVLGLWFSVFGEGLVPMRLLSVACTVVLVGAWGSVVRRLTGNAVAAVLAAALIACNAHVLWGASMGRPEPLATALAVGGAALYLRWRQAHLTRAVCVAAALVGLGMLAHPLALVPGLGLAAVAVALDGRRLRWHHVATAVAVGALVLSPWALYIAQDPETFRAQWAANGQTRTGSRDAGLRNPLGALLSDFGERYLRHNFTDVKGFGRVLGVELAAVVACWVAGLGLALASPAFRARRGVRLLALFAGVAWGALAVLDASRYRQYFLHVYPALVAVAALVVWELARRGGAARWAAGALAAVMIVPGLGGVANRIVVNPYRTSFLPAAAVAQGYQARGGRVAAGSEFAFALGFDSALRDDMDMRTPADVYVQGEFFEYFTQGRPVRAVLARDYRPVFRNDRYTVYARRTQSSAGTPAPAAPGS